MIPLGRACSISADIADLVKIIEASGLNYRLAAARTILEGNWDQLMAVAHNCHTEMHSKTDRVVTLMKLDATTETASGS